MLLRRPHRRRKLDQGFVLLESIIAIMLITVLMTALTALFVTTMQSNTRQRDSQNAVRVMTEQADYLRSLAADGALPPPSDTPITLNGIDYTVTWTCSRGSSAGTACDPATGASQAAAADASDPLQLDMTVTWNTSNCPAEGCHYTDSMLIDDTPDPVFANSFTRPSGPTLACTDPSIAAGTPFDLQILGSGGFCTVNGGEPGYTWSSTDLPTGLQIDPRGRITGQLQAASGTSGTGGECTPPQPTASSQNLSLTVTDAYLRTSTSNLSLSVSGGGSVQQGYYIRDQYTIINWGLTNKIVDFDALLFDGTGRHTYSDASAGKGNQNSLARFPDGFGGLQSNGQIVTNSFPYNFTEKVFTPTIRVTSLDNPSDVRNITFNWHATKGTLVKCPSGFPADLELKVGDSIPPFNIYDYFKGGTSPYRFNLDTHAQDFQPLNWLHINPNTGELTGVADKISSHDPVHNPPTYLTAQIQVWDAGGSYQEFQWKLKVTQGP